MSATSEMAAFDRGVRPLLRIVMPEKAAQVIHFRADPELRERIESLACKSTEGQLSEQKERSTPDMSVRTSLSLFCSGKHGN